MSAPTLPHAPVMVAECLEGLNLQQGRWYVDATFGAGGHSRALLKAGVNVLAIDQDPTTLTYLNALVEELGLTDRTLKMVQGNFRQLDLLAEQAGVAPVAGVLLDLGLSSMQLDEEGRGFAFRQKGPLDMRMSGRGPSAADLVNTAEQAELAAILHKYGEERYSRRLARAIVSARPIHITERLVEVISSAYPPGPRRDHPARRTFQALRIAVNDELSALEDALEASANVLATAGRLVVMSYHSLEDRRVKHTFKQSRVLSALTKRPLTASPQEVAANPRARSAKLRVAEKLAPVGGAA